jgi:hypothetical protein
MHNKMTRAQYDDHLNDYKQSNYLPVHLDAHTVNGTVYYSGIGSTSTRLGRFAPTATGASFNATTTTTGPTASTLTTSTRRRRPTAIRYGGIWFFDSVPQVNDNSSLSLKIRKEVDWRSGARRRSSAQLDDGSKGDAPRRSGVRHRQHQQDRDSLRLAARD